MEAGDEYSSDRFCLLILMSWSRESTSHCKIRHTALVSHCCKADSALDQQLCIMLTYIPLVVAMAIIWQLPW